MKDNAFPGLQLEPLTYHRRGHWFESSTAQFLTGLFHQFRDDIIVSLLGPGGSRILELRGKSNPELLKLYDVELVLRLHNARNLKDTRRLLEKFTIFLAGQPPSAVQAKAFLAGYAGRQPRTVYRYLQMLRPFLKWCGDPITDLKIKIPKSLPPYTDDSQVESLRAQVRNKKSHKSLIERDLLLIDTAEKTGMRRADLANLAKSDIHDDFIIVRKGKRPKLLLSTLLSFELPQKH